MIEASSVSLSKKRLATPVIWSLGGIDLPERQKNEVSGEADQLTSLPTGRIVPPEEHEEERHAEDF